MGGGRDKGRSDRHRDRGSRRDRLPGGKESITDRGNEMGPPPGSVILLKRPDSTTPSGSQSVSSLRDAAVTRPSSESKAADERGQTVSVKPTGILMRSAQGLPKHQETHGNESRSTVAPQLGNAEVKQLKQGDGKPRISQYKFPSDHAMPFLNIGKELKFLTDMDFVGKNSSCTDFFVVTVVGPPQTGKSNVLSFLGDTTKEFGASKIFRPRELREQKEGQVYMTPNRLVLIEMPALFNGGVSTEMVTMFGSHGTLETAAVAWNLKLMSWALTISHMVIIVSEQVIDPNILQLLNTAPVVNPADFVFGENFSPQIMYVCNKASLSLLKDNTIAASCKEILESAIGRPSKLKENYFILPRTNVKGHEERFRQFKKHVLDFVCYNRAIYAAELKQIKRFPQSVSVGEWYQYAHRIWEDFGQHPSSGLHSYLRLLPQSKILR